MLVFVSCSKPKTYTNISLEKVLSFRVKYEASDNINPFTDENYDFIGTPGAIAYMKDYELFPFMLIGKNLSKNNSYSCQFVATLLFDMDGVPKKMGIAIPVEEKFKSVSFSSFEELNLNFPEVKIWISDWFNFAFRKNKISQIRWANEMEILRAINETNTKK